jgi:hypothetical protein
LNLQTVHFWNVAGSLLMVIRQRSFFPRNGDGVKEYLHRRLAKTPAALMRPFLVVTSDPIVEIVLQLPDLELLAEGFERQIRRDDGRATFVTLTKDLEKHGLGKRDRGDDI